MSAEARKETAALSRTVEDVQNTLARNLFAARGALNMSQEDLAGAAGVSRATINQLEQGSSAKGDPRLSTVVRLAAALELSPVFLLLGRDELHAITEVPKSREVNEVRSRLSAEKLETMRWLLSSDVPKNRAKAVQMGAEAARTSGISEGVIAAAAIGTALWPGMGTAIGAALVTTWLAKKKLDKKKDE